LKKENLIEGSDDLAPSFAGLDRREVIKKIGAGSILALPVIASLIAPTPIHAASSCASSSSCTCTTPSNHMLGGTCVATILSACPSNCACKWASNGNGDLSGICGP